MLGVFKSEVFSWGSRERQGTKKDEPGLLEGEEMGVELGHGQKNRETPYFTNLVSFRGGKTQARMENPHCCGG